MDKETKTVLLFDPDMKEMVPSLDPGDILPMKELLQVEIA